MPQGPAPTKIKTTPVKQAKSYVTNNVTGENRTAPLDINKMELEKHIQKQNEMLRDQLRKAGGKSSGKVPPKEVIDEMTKSGRVVF